MKAVRLLQPADNCASDGDNKNLPWHTCSQTCNVPGGPCKCGCASHLQDIANLPLDPLVEHLATVENAASLCVYQPVSAPSEILLSKTRTWEYALLDFGK